MSWLSGLSATSISEAGPSPSTSALERSPTGKQQAGQEGLAGAVEDVGLVLRGVGATRKPEAAVFLHYARIVPGGDVRRAQAVGYAQQFRELEQAVADDAGIGGEALQVSCR